MLLLVNIQTGKNFYYILKLKNDMPLILSIKLQSQINCTIKKSLICLRFGMWTNAQFSFLLYTHIPLLELFTKKNILTTIFNMFSLIYLLSILIKQHHLASFQFYLLSSEFNLLKSPISSSILLFIFASSSSDLPLSLASSA